MKKFSIKPVFSKELIKHMFLDNVSKNDDKSDRILFTYVIEDYKTKQITDVFSFYSLPKVSSKHYPAEIKYLNVSYAYYCFPSKHDIQTLMKLSIAKADELGFDLFNTLDVMEAYKYLHDLKFQTKESTQYFYMYNWFIPVGIASHQLGLLMTV
jgi:glycylpeptide N-tetradecanoyltransferase